MSRPDVAIYVEDFFTRLFCAQDDTVAVQAINTEIAEDADMVINGNACTRDQFSQMNVQAFRAMCEAKITDVKDLNVLTEDGKTGSVSQYCTFEITVKGSGQVTKQTATTLLRVSPKPDGGRTISGIWEVVSPA